MSIFSRRLAVIISWLGHPLVFVTISAAIVFATQLASGRAIGLIGALFLAVIAPTGVLLFLGVVPADGATRMFLCAKNGNVFIQLRFRFPLSGLL